MAHLHRLSGIPSSNGRWKFAKSAILDVALAVYFLYNLDMRPRRETPKFPGIYAIVHVASGRRYIGSARNIYNRWRGHKSNLNLNKHHSPRLQNTWNKYGKETFVFVVLERCVDDQRTLIGREQHWLDTMRPFSAMLFNCAANALSHQGVPCSQEQKAFLSNLRMGNKHSLGSHHGKLDEPDIVDILTGYASGESVESLASRYNSHRMHIGRIVARKVWWRVEIAPEIEAACRARYGRRATGFANKMTKIGPDEAAVVKGRIARGDKASAIARDYGVTPAAINGIRRGTAYAYVKPREYRDDNAQKIQLLLF